MRVRDLMDDQLFGRPDQSDHPQSMEGPARARMAEPDRRSAIRDPDDLKVTGLSEQTINEIDALFPERSADPRDSDREVWMKAGERRLVRFLIDQYKLAHNLTENDD